MVKEKEWVIEAWASQVVSTGCDIKIHLKTKDGEFGRLRTVI